MFKDIKIPLEHHTNHIKFDRVFYKKLREFRISWTQKSDEYIQFLGSNLLGVHTVRFSTQDDEKLLIDVYGVDLTNLRKDIYNTKGVRTDWKVSSNPIYILLMYTIHKYWKNKKLDRKTREGAIKEAYLIFSYKAMSSLLYNWFSYPVDPAIAQAAYEKLSNRYLIKKLGTWEKVFEYRANKVASITGLHYKRFQRFNVDDNIRILNDLQGALKGTVKNLYLIIKDIVDNNSKLGIRSSTQEDDENGEAVTELTDRPDKYVTYLFDILHKKNDFIKDDLIEIVHAVVPNLDKRVFKDILGYISDSNTITQNSKEDFITPIIYKSIAYLTTKNVTGDYVNDLIDNLYFLKGYWSSSKNKDKEIQDVKKVLFKIVKDSTGKKTKWIVITNVLGILLYMFLRSLVRNTHS